MVRWALVLGRGVGGGKVGVALGLLWVQSLEEKREGGSAAGGEGSESWCAGLLFWEGAGRDVQLRWGRGVC